MQGFPNREKLVVDEKELREFLSKFHNGEPDARCFLIANSSSGDFHKDLDSGFITRQNQQFISTYIKQKIMEDKSLWSPFLLKKLLDLDYAKIGYEDLRDLNELPED